MRIDRIKLVSELEKRDMTQKRLAELSGVSRVTINYIKGGKRCTDEVGRIDHAYIYKIRFGSLRCVDGRKSLSATIRQGYAKAYRMVRQKVHTGFI